MSEIFVDRETQPQKFNENLNRLISQNNSENAVLYYSGAGGVGKSALIRELENSLATGENNFNVKAANYSFSENPSMLTTLTALKEFLSSRYNVEFTYFKKGCSSYCAKGGEESGKCQVGNIFRGNRFLNYCRKKAGIVVQQSSNADFLIKFLIGNNIDSILTQAGYPAICTPIFTFKKIIDGACVCSDKFSKRQLEKNPAYQAVLAELNKRENFNSPEAIKEYLPTLFAKDISKWLAEKNLYLVIFLDTYEKLTEDEKDTACHKKLVSENDRCVSQDWWIEDLIKNTDRVLWVIAGRSALEKIGDATAINRLNLAALDNNFADEFLKISGVENANLREGIIKLTGGYPNYLAVCVDTYKTICANNRTPRLEDFGKKREKVIYRLLENMNDSSKMLLYRLCILGTWTDNLAAKVLCNFGEYSPDAYKRLKNLSFVTAEKFEGKNLFVFDRSIQKILLDYLKDNSNFAVLIPQTRYAVNKVFKKIFSADEEKNLDLYFKIWCNVILNSAVVADDLVTPYKANLESLIKFFDSAIQKEIIEDFQTAVKNLSGTDNNCYKYFANLIAQIKFSEGNKDDALELAKNAYEKISAASNNEIQNIDYSLALFYAMGTDETTAEYQNFKQKFITAVKNIPADERKIALSYYGYFLKYLLDVYRNSRQVIKLIDKTINFIGNDKEFFNTFIADLQSYKNAAESHLGIVKKFDPAVAENYITAIQAGNYSDLYIIDLNRMIVNLQDVFDYAKSLELGNRVINLLEDLMKNSNELKDNHEKFISCKDQYCRVCGSMALTCYLTFNNSHDNLDSARKFAKIAIDGFTKESDKVRPCQTLAQVEAEVGNFEEACTMLDRGLNFNIKNPQVEQFEEFPAFSWYHFAKFSERLLKSGNTEYFNVAKNALEISKETFNSYLDNFLTNLNDNYTNYNPNRTTFSKIGTCFDILGDKDFSIKCHKAALRVINTEIAEKELQNLNSLYPEALRLVMLANFLLTAEKNNYSEKAESLKIQLRNSLDEYLNHVDIDSMKLPFDGWRDLILNIENIEKMCRAVIH